MRKVFFRAGIDPEGSYLPAWLQANHVTAPQYDMDSAGKEAQMVMCGAVSEVLEKTGGSYKPTLCNQCINHVCCKGMQRKTCIACGPCTPHCS